MGWLVAGLAFSVLKQAAGTAMSNIFQGSSSSQRHAIERSQALARQTELAGVTETTEQIKALTELEKAKAGSSFQRGTYSGPLFQAFTRG